MTATVTRHRILAAILVPSERKPLPENITGEEQ